MRWGFLVFLLLLVALAAGCGKKSEESKVKQAPIGPKDAAVAAPADAGVAAGDASRAAAPGSPDIEVPQPVIE